MQTKTARTAQRRSGTSSPEADDMKIHSATKPSDP